MSVAPLVDSTIEKSVAGIMMADVKANAAALRILRNRNGNNTIPEKMSRIPFILP
jgi:hypothetical protein